MISAEAALAQPISIVGPSPELLKLLEVMPGTFPQAGYPISDYQAARATTDEMMRNMLSAAAPQGWEGRPRRETLPTPSGELPVWIVEPKGDDRGSLLHIHGGGWFSGSAEMMAPALVRWADALGAVVASVEYRLAPEHPYPAAPDDCEAAALWWVEEARRRYGHEKIVVGGESAGSHLAAVTTIRMRQKHGYAFAGTRLVYGLFDFGNGLPSRRVADGRNLVQDSRSCDFYADVFVPDHALRGQPDVSPVHAELAGMPPALLTVGTLDPFLDDNILLASRWLTAGNEAHLVLYREGFHGFDMTPTPEAEHHAALIQAFTEKCWE